MWESMLRHNLVAPLRTARVFIPLLRIKRGLLSVILKLRETIVCRYAGDRDMFLRISLLEETDCLETKKTFILELQRGKKNTVTS